MNRVLQFLPLLVLLAMLPACERQSPPAEQASDTAPGGTPASSAVSPESDQKQTADASAESASEVAEQPLPPSLPAPEAPKERDATEVAIISTTAGDMVVEFWPDVAPKTVANFKKLAREGFYDGTAFHRIIKGFMIQGGDPLTKDPSQEAMYGTGNPGYTVPAEFNDRKHVRGVLSMARSSHPDSAGSQFFICLDPAPSLDGLYTGFGKLIKGEDVLLKIGNTPVTASRTGEPSKPVERIEIKSIKIAPKNTVI